MSEIVEKNGSPGEWTSTTVGELSEIVTSGSRNWSKYYSDEGALFVRTQDIKRNRLAKTGIPRVKLPERAEGKRTRIRKGDLLITITGYIGRVAAVDTELEEAYVSQSVALVRLRNPEYSKFIQHQLLEKHRGATQLEAMAYGLGRPVLNLDNIRNARVKIAPFDQQKHIVAEIEKQFSRLDEAVANLKRVKANLKRYKAAVLKAAVEGRLVETEAEIARREGRSYETGTQLLQRILETRRSQWKGKGKYKEPAAPDTTDLPELPEGWVWATVEQLSCLVEYGSSAKTNEDSSGVPVLRMGNIFEGKLRFDELKYLPSNHDEFPKLLLRAGDLLFNRTNSPELVGKTAVYIGSPKKCSYASYLIRVRLLGGVASDLLATYINSSHGRNWVKSVVTQQVGQANVNGTKLQALSIPLPPEFEQDRIVAELDRRLSLLRETESQVDANIQRAERLRQSVLADAFSGKLLRHLEPLRAVA